MSVPPPYSPPLDEATTALLALLRTSGRTVYDAAYGGDPTNPTFPYAILDTIPGGSGDPFPDLDLDLTAVTAAWQVTAVSNYRNQAQQTARVLLDLVIGRDGGGWAHPIVLPAGWQVADRRPHAPAGLIRTGEQPGTVFTAPLRFSLTLTREETPEWTPS